MNQSFELLSSMSPKINRAKRNVRRGRRVLALKNYFRRSSVYDHAHVTVKNDSLVLIETTSAETKSDDDKSSNKVINSPIVIRDTSDSESSENIRSDRSDKNKSHFNFKTQNDTSVDQYQKNDSKSRFLSKEKKHEIEVWIDNVTVNSADSESSKFSEVSSIQGDILNKAEREVEAVNSTFVDAAAKRFDELFKKDKNVTKDKNTWRTYKRYTSSSEESVDISTNNKVTSIEEEFGKLTKQVAPKSNNLNNEDIIINDSLDNLSIKSSLTDNSKQVTETNSAGIENDTKKIGITGRQNTSKLQRTTHNSEVTNEARTPIKAFREAEDRELSSNGNCDSNYVCSFLDDIYGNTWRQNQETILSMSERKPTKVLNQKPRKNIPKSEQKPKKSVLDKNPYVAPENQKSNKLLHTLQKARIKAALESPWVSKLKSVCDPESSIEESDEHILKPTRLNFENEIERESNRKMYTKDEDDLGIITQKTKTLTVSDIQNISDVSDLGETLEDRIRKKINNIKEPPKTAPVITNKKVINKKGEAKGKENKEIVTKKKTRKKIDSFIVSSESSGDDQWSSKESSEKNCVNLGKGPSGTYSFLASLSGNVPITKCDMSARIFRNNYKHFRDELTKKLFALYNTKIFDSSLPADIEIVWNDRLRGTAGRCDCKKITHRTGVIERKAKIQLSTKVLDSPDRLRDTLVHELCHAVTWIVNKVADGHGPIWKGWAAKAMKTFPELPPIGTCHNYAINTKYTYKCTSCGYSLGRHSKSLDIERKRCGYCYGTFEVLINKISKNGEVRSVPATPRKQLQGFALFVKENYAQHKVHQLSHAEVMKLLGQKFNELKAE